MRLDFPCCVVLMLRKVDLSTFSTVIYFDYWLGLKQFGLMYMLPINQPIIVSYFKYTCWYPSFEIFLFIFNYMRLQNVQGFVTITFNFIKFFMLVLHLYLKDFYLLLEDECTFFYWIWMFLLWLFVSCLSQTAFECEITLLWPISGQYLKNKEIV